MAAPAQGQPVPNGQSAAPQQAPQPPQQIFMTEQDRRDMQRSTDYFDAYWRGEQDQWLVEDNAGRREPIYRTFPVPRPQTHPRVVPMLDPSASSRRRWLPQDAAQTAAQQTRWITQAQSPYGGIGVMEYARPMGLVLRRVLGKGGMGMACLFEMLDPDGTSRELVVKASTLQEDVATELRNLNAMNGASHIVQRIFFRNLPVSQLRNGDRVDTSDIGGHVVDGVRYPGLFDTPQQVRNLFDVSQNLYAMEYMRHGDLVSLIMKANAMGRRFKDQELWQIFECLFNACIALAYPGQFTNPDVAGGEFIPGWGAPQMSEQLPRGPAGVVPPVTPLIHFDLDVQNTMMGDFNAAHQSVPIVKVGDLGVGVIMTDEERLNLPNMIRHRNNGKDIILTPEQNSLDWAYIDRAPVLLGEPVAGNFNYWTNLYQAGLIMYQMVTLVSPDQPPQAYQTTISGAEEGSFRRQYWTYGGVIEIGQDLDQLHDVDLRKLIAWCMAVQPTDRPSLEALDEILNLKCDPARWNGPELAAHLKISIRDLLETPPN